MHPCACDDTVHTEINLSSNETMSNCVDNFWIDFEPEGIPTGSKSSVKV